MSRKPRKPCLLNTTTFKTMCCDAYDTFHGDVHVCRKCQRRITGYTDAKGDRL